ncbi:MAG: DUF2064 domain-containing protein [Thermoanaerobaculia bacterium]|nr:DUF2064 domain-containing protein [Thermoanaerobaculia bacterium]
MDTRSQATLLVFTRGPVRERRRRLLLPAHSQMLERQLYLRCLDEAVAAGSAAGCRVVVSSPEPVAVPASVERLHQSGSGFGARLMDALARAGRNAAPVVVVGTDAPGLTARTVRDSLAELRRDPERVVVGPSPDGGFYLLAATRPLTAELEQVAWCRRGALASLLAALARAGRPVTLLAPLADLDRPADLERLLARGGLTRGVWRDLGRRLAELLAGLKLPPAPPVLPPLGLALAGPTPPRAPPR